MGDAMTDDEAEIAREIAEQRFIERLREVTAAERAETRLAVRDGIVEAGEKLLTPENAEKFWSAAVSVLQQRAAQKTGSFVLAGLWAGARKIFWIALIVVGLWSAFGAAGLMSAWKALVSARAPQ